jgi:hypothetical protein
MDPINFPNSPSDNDIYSSNGQTWKYSQALNAWDRLSASAEIRGLIQEGSNIEILGEGTPASPYVISAIVGSGTGGGPGGSIVSATPPLNPDDGQIWDNTTNGQRYVWWASQSIWVSGTGVSDIQPEIADLVAPPEIVTESASFTLSQATHWRKWVRLTSETAQDITLPTGTEIEIGCPFTFFVATDQAIGFINGTVAGASRLADVVQNSAFGLVYRGGGNYDFV